MTDLMSRVLAQALKKDLIQEILGEGSPAVLVDRGAEAGHEERPD
jgi:hypothetical protein